FFQAEDGIRDATVTGVQTCALPISLTYFDLARQYGGGSLAQALGTVAARTLLIAFSSDWLYPPSASNEVEQALRALGKPAEFHRSEERRVGKGGESWRQPVAKESKR